MKAPGLAQVSSEEVGRERHAGRARGEGPGKAEAKRGGGSRSPGHWSPGAGRGGTLLRACGGWGPATPSFCTRVSSWDRTHLCGSQPPRLWQCVQQLQEADPWPAQSAPGWSLSLPETLHTGPLRLCPRLLHSPSRYFLSSYCVPAPGKARAVATVTDAVAALRAPIYQLLSPPSFLVPPTQCRVFQALSLPPASAPWSSCHRTTHILHSILSPHLLSSRPSSLAAPGAPRGLPPGW